MRAFYNDFDPKACAWTRELIRAGLVPDGVVDERSIHDLTGADFDGFTQIHLFNGICGWAYALGLAGWPADRPVMCGSCPCQPYSAAGKGLGDADPRNLWPEMFRLIRESRPPVCLGEQVPNAIGHGWLDGVFADLEAEGYACGALVLPACSVGAPHIRQRLFWVASRVAVAGGAERDGRAEPAGERGGTLHAANRCGADGVANAERAERRPHVQHVELPGGREQAASGPRSGRDARGVGDADPAGLEKRGRERGDDGAELPPAERAGGEFLRLADSTDTARRGGERLRGCGTGDGPGELPLGGYGSVDAPWGRYDLIPCRDGKFRRAPQAAAGIEPVLQRVVDGFPGSLDNRRAILNALAGFPLAEGIRGRPTLLRGYGNAINPHVAAAFIQAFLETEKPR